MAVNRVLYLLSLLLSAVFYFASGTWFSWILLVLLAALPWVSLLFSLPAMLGSRIQVRLPLRAEQGESALMHLRVEAPRWLPAPEVQLRLNLRTRDREKDIRYLSRLSRTDGVLALPTEDCGAIWPAFRKGRVYDALGLLWLPLRTPQLHPMAILPAARQPASLPNPEQLLVRQLRPKPGGGFAENHDHRPYRPGDPVKGIHWKLSQKTDELIVREPLEPVERRICLAARTPRGPEQRAQALGSLRWLSGWLLDREVPHSLVWMAGNQPVHREIRDQEALLDALAEACMAPEDSAELPAVLPFPVDMVWRVGEKGGAA